MEFGQSTFDMVKGDDGYWSVTTKPLLPGFHYYAISVDGFPANDPGSRVFFAARKEVSGLEIPGPDSVFFAITDAPHGTVYVASGTSRKRQARRDGFSFIRRRDTIRVGYTTRSFIFSTGMEKTKPVGLSRAMRTSFWTI